MRFRRCWLLLVASALVAGACDTGETAETGWSRVPHDEKVFGGEGSQTMASVTAGGPGLVAVGWAGSRNDDAAVWVTTTNY